MQISSSGIVEAGCTRCNQKFTLPTDEQGNPVWVHDCPAERMERMEKTMTGMAKQIDELTRKVQNGT